MGSNVPNAKRVDRAVPVIRRAKHSDVAKVATTRAMHTGMQGSALWTANPALQAAATTWSAAADVLDANAKVIVDLRGKLAAAMATQRAGRRNWTDATKHILANVAMVTQGSADQVNDLGFDVLTQSKRGTLQGAPTGIISGSSKVPGEAIVKWDRGGAKHGFLVQHATNSADPATISPAIPCTKTTFKLQGLTTASTVQVRVAAIDPASPTGHSPWSEWITATAR